METKQYTLAEVKKHIDTQSSWVVIHNNVYDLTEFLNEVLFYCLFINKSLNYTSEVALSNHETLKVLYLDWEP